MPKGGFEWYGPRPPLLLGPTQADNHTNSVKSVAQMATDLKSRRAIVHWQT